jgi:peptide/nickel transport system permease protein
MISALGQGSGRGGFLLEHLPGASLIARGRRTEGTLLLLFFLAFPVVILANTANFIDSWSSLVLTVRFMITDSGLGPILLRGEVIEHWVAVLFLVSMPVFLHHYARKNHLLAMQGSDEHELSQWGLAWREFRQHRLAMGALGIIMTMYSVAFLCPFLAPYNPNVFQDGVVTRFVPPLHSITVLRLKEPRISSPAPEALQRHSTDPQLFNRLIAINRRLVSHDFLKEMAVDAYHVEGAVVMATVGENLVRIPIHNLVSHEPEVFSRKRFHALGTDSYGRDLLSRIIYGSRISLSLGFIAVLLSVTVGTIIGLFAGYFGRFTDTLLMRFVDVLLAFPSLFLILIIIAAFETIAMPRILLIVIVLGLTSWMSISRLVRAEVLSIKERDFVLAAQALGLGSMRILFRHILPNAMTPIIINATLRIGGIILVEAALSYLNLGVQQPTASWGNIIFEGKDFLSYAWWISTLPGFAIVIVVVCFNLVGDGLRDAFDPMLSESR